MAIEKVGDLTPAVLEEILQRSLANPAIRVTHVQEPAGQSGLSEMRNTQAFITAGNI